MTIVLSMKLFAFVDPSWPADDPKPRTVLAQLRPSVLHVPGDEALKHLLPLDFEVAVRRAQPFDRDELALLFTGAPDTEGVKRWADLCYRKFLPCEVVLPNGVPARLRLMTLDADLSMVRNALRGLWQAFPEKRGVIELCGVLLVETRHSPTSEKLTAAWNAVETLSLQHPDLAVWLVTPLALLGAWTERFLV